MLKSIKAFKKLFSPLSANDHESCWGFTRIAQLLDLFLSILESGPLYRPTTSHELTKHELDLDI